MCFGAPNVPVACSKQELFTLLKFKHSVKDDFGMLSPLVVGRGVRPQIVEFRFSFHGNCLLLPYLL